MLDNPKKKKEKKRNHSRWVFLKDNNPPHWHLGSAEQPYY